MRHHDIFDAVDALLAGVCTGETVSAIETGGSVQALWQALEDSGFTDALVPEDLGGAGLPLEAAYAIALAAGRHVVPAPWVQTLLLRGALGSHGVRAPSGPLAVASACACTASVWQAQVPMGRDAAWVIVVVNGRGQAWPTADARVEGSAVYGNLDATWHWSAPPATAIDLPSLDWRALAALAGAGLIAGALERAFEITTRYANERVQFGKPIAKLQVIQQQLSVMAEHVFAARMAAQIGFHSSGSVPQDACAAVAKQRCSEAVAVCAPIAHAVHGAMGFTAEYELQRYTRRLHEWRLAYGGEGHWAQRLGEAFLHSDTHALDAVRAWTD